MRIGKSSLMPSLPRKTYGLRWRDVSEQHGVSAQRER
jgi:hypothetical protein